MTVATWNRIQHGDSDSESGGRGGVKEEEEEEREDFGATVCTTAVTFCVDVHTNLQGC